MLVHILGSGAGGGFPQWNCRCAHCQGVRTADIRARPRTQSSIAVSSDGKAWALINASPDIRAQIDTFPAIQPGHQPGRALRATGIAAVVLMDSQIDHVTGLLSLREGRNLTVYCTAQVEHDLTVGLPLFPVLRHYLALDLHVIDLSAEGGFSIDGVDGLRFTAVAVHSKAPPYSPHRQDPHLGDHIGLVIRDEHSRRSLLYAPGLGCIDAPLAAHLADADCALLDGTFWREDEMCTLGLSEQRAADMGHLPQSGEQGLIAALRAFPKPRTLLVHINNTNPILNEDSPERRQLTAAGIEVAYDGLEFSL